MAPFEEKLLVRSGRTGASRGGLYSERRERERERDPVRVEQRGSVELEPFGRLGAPMLRVLI